MTTQDKAIKRQTKRFKDASRKHLESHSEQQAKAQYESIADMVKRLTDATSDLASERAEQTIQEDALSVEVRSDWHAVGGDYTESEYMLLLCTGGPAVRIIGTLDGHGEPITAHIQHQDWGTPWTEYRLANEQEQTVLTYARCFYYGE